MFSHVAPRLDLDLIKSKKIPTTHSRFHPTILNKPLSPEATWLEATAKFHNHNKLPSFIVYFLIINKLKSRITEIQGNGDTTPTQHDGSPLACQIPPSMSAMTGPPMRSYLKLLNN